MHFCFFKSHQLISGSDRTEVHLAKESRKSTIFDRKLVSRGLMKAGFFQTKFNFGHECSQYSISYKSLYTPKFFLIQTSMILFPFLRFIYTLFFFFSKIFRFFTRSHGTQFNMRSGFSYYQKKFTHHMRHRSKFCQIISEVS